MADYVMFQHSIPQGIVLLLYVDYTIITRNHPITIESLTRHLHTEFKMKDLGFLRYFLGFEDAYPSQAIFRLNENILLIFSIELIWII